MVNVEKEKIKFGDRPGGLAVVDFQKSLEEKRLFQKGKGEGNEKSQLT